VQYNFDWDPKKARENVVKHKVSFERGAGIFLDPNAISIFDEEHSEYEDRWITVGIDKTGVLLVVIHTFIEEDQNECLIRIISVRKATNKEAKQY
jgi:uncharacterized DUF497 family protein